MLMVDPDDEKFVLGGRGLAVQFCVFSDTLRACKEHWNGAYNEICLTCLQSKANIGNWTGFRDNLLFLLDEELSNIPLCSLHCEMRNTEQLLGSLGLFAFRCGCIDECNRAIANYGPENSWGYDRIQIKPREGQQTAIIKSNVKVSSFSGSTAKAFLVNCDEIVTQSLLMDIVVTYYKQVSGAAKDVLEFVSFIDSVKDYLEEIIEKGTFVRDYGVRQEEVLVKDNKVFKEYLENEVKEWMQEMEVIESSFLVIDKALPSPPKKKTRKKATIVNSATGNEEMAVLAAILKIKYFKKVFERWKEIDLVIRDERFEDMKRRRLIFLMLSAGCGVSSDIYLVSLLELVTMFTTPLITVPCYSACTFPLRIIQIKDLKHLIKSIEHYIQEQQAMIRLELISH